ncbi:MAG TPA: TadE family protein [Candidatus Limnocylindrales bacterium]
MRSPRRRRRESRGQALVEFSLIIPIFLAMFTGIIEFGVAFSVKMQVTFASRDAAIVLAESGAADPLTADCAILSRIDQDFLAPAQRSNIDHVDIFWATASGGVNNGAVETYKPTGTLGSSCPTLVWSRTQDLYPAQNRCSSISGSSLGLCQASPVHSGPDRIGVTIVYKYSWTTPLPSLIGLSGNGLSFSQTNLTTIEPVPPST